MLAIERQLFQQFLILHRPYKQRFDMLLGQYSLSTYQWWALVMLAEHQELMASEMATMQCVEKPSMTKTLQKLEQLQYVTARVGEDKRQRLFRLSSTGVTLVKRVEQELLIDQKELLTNVTFEEMQTTIHVLQQISHHLKKEAIK